MTSAGLDSQAVRAVIREVLAELLPETLAAASANGAGPPDGRPGLIQPRSGQPGVAQPGLAYTVRDDVQSVETVSLRTDADLDAFVKHLLRLFESHAIRVVALSIANSVDCAFVRIMVNDADRGREILQLSKFAFAEIDLIGVAAPDSNAEGGPWICKATSCW